MCSSDLILARINGAEEAKKILDDIKNTAVSYTHLPADVENLLCSYYLNSMFLLILVQIYKKNRGKPHVERNIYKEIGRASCRERV